MRRARAVAVLTSNDLANIETALIVDDLLDDQRDDVPVVVRVFDRDLAHTVETGFHFHTVRSTAALAAPWFVGAALGLDILKTFYVDHQPMLIARLTVADAGGLAGHVDGRAVGPHPGHRHQPARSRRRRWSSRRGATTASTVATWPTWSARTRSCCRCCAPTPSAEPADSAEPAEPRRRR